MPTKKHAPRESTTSERIMLATEPHAPAVIIDTIPSRTVTSDHPPESGHNLFGKSFAEAIKAAVTPSP